jgi:ATP-binding cassette subfamily F protein 3
MISISNLAKGYSAQTLFDNVTLTISPGERIGVLGRNGHGKSTLFKLILGIEEPDGGTIAVPKDYSIGHLSQNITHSQPTVLAEAALCLPTEERMTPYRVERALFGLGFSAPMLQMSCSLLSGGYQLRLELAKLLVRAPNMLLLDEPTNYLDLPAIRWIKAELKSWPGELMLISHDKDFMDSITTHTLAIYRRKIRKIEGSSTKLRELIAQDEEIHQRTRKNLLKRKEEIEQFAAKYRAQASKSTLVQSRLKELDKLDIEEELTDDPVLQFSFNYLECPAKRLLEVRHLTFGYNSNTAPLISDLTFAVERGERLGIIGKNGRGKSTLLRLLVGELQSLQGELNFHDKCSVGYLGQSNVERLLPQLTVEEEIQQANPQLSKRIVRSICGAMMFSGMAAEKKINVLSGGERNRVMLGKIIAQQTNLIFLDEPTNHLDIESIDSLMNAIDEFDGAVVFVTHSEFMLKRLAKKLIIFRDNEIRYFPGTYEEFCDQIGFGDDETYNENSFSSEKTRNGANHGLSNKQRRQKERERPKLSRQFDEVSTEIKVIEEAIQRANEKGDVFLLLNLTRQKDELEVRQLELLEKLEAMQQET